MYEREYVQKYHKLLQYITIERIGKKEITKYISIKSDQN